MSEPLKHPSALRAISLAAFGIALLLGCGNEGRDASSAPLDHPLIEAAVVAKHASTSAGIHGMTSRIAGAGSEVIFADSFGNADSQRSLYRVPASSGPITKLPVNGQLPAGLLWHDGTLFVCDTVAGTIRRFDANLQLIQTWSAASPWSVTTLEDGTLLSVSYDGKVQRLSSDGDVETLFDGLNFPFGIARGKNGTVWVSEQGATGQPGRVTRRKLDGAIVEQIPLALENPEGLLVDDTESLWIADTATGRIYRKKLDAPAKLLSRGMTLPIVFAPAPSGDAFVNGAKAELPNAYGIWRLNAN